MLDVDRPQLREQLLIVLLTVGKIRASTSQELVTAFAVFDDDVLGRVLEAVLSVPLHGVGLLLQQSIESPPEFSYRNIPNYFVQVAVRMNGLGAYAIEVV